MSRQNLIEQTEQGRRNLIEQTEQGEVGEVGELDAELQSLSRKDALYAELQSLTRDELERVYNAWRDDEYGKQLIFEERRRCCGQGAFLFTASLVLTVAKSALVGYATTSYYAIDSIDFRAEPGIKFGFYAGLLSIIPAGCVFGAIGVDISRWHDMYYPKRADPFIISYALRLFFIAAGTGTVALSMLSDDSLSEVNSGNDQNDFLVVFLYAVLDTPFALLLAWVFGMIEEQYDTGVCSLPQGPEMQRRFLRWVISKKGADSFMPPQGGTGLLKAAITESATLNANRGGGGGGGGGGGRGGPRYGAV